MNQSLDGASSMILDAGAMLRGYYESGVEVKSKGDIDLVTSADHSVEEFILDWIQSNYPSHSIWAEESGQKEGGLILSTERLILLMAWVIFRFWWRCKNESKVVLRLNGVLPSIRCGKSYSWPKRVRAACSMGVRFEFPKPLSCGSPFFALVLVTAA